MKNSKYKTGAIVAGIILAAWALHRWRAAHDMNVPLDIAFKHPFTSIQTLYDRIHAGYTQG